MNISEFSVKRPVTIQMFLVAIVLLGVVSLVRLPVERDPNVSFGSISIIVQIRGGMPPEEVESLVTRVVEDAVSGVSHLENMYSGSKISESTVTLEFEPGIDMNFAAMEVREKFARVKDKLPKEIEKPIIAQYKQSDVPIMLWAVTGKGYSTEQLRRIVEEQIKERILRVDGVANVEVYGGRERKILVEVSESRLQAQSLPIQRVVNIVGQSNLSLLAGEIERQKDKYLVRTLGEFQDISQIENMQIRFAPFGPSIRLKDIAQVKDSYLEPTSLARTNLSPVVSIYIQKTSTANTIRAVEAIKREIKRVTEKLDKNISIVCTFDQSESIKAAIKSVKDSLIQGSILSVAVLIFFLKSLKLTSIIAVTIPASVMITFILMYFQKITLNIMTLSGLSLGIGMLVDNSIVVLDNIYKKREKVEIPEDKAVSVATAISGASEVSLAIIASTITTIVVFLPFVFVNKEIRMIWSGLVFTVIFSLVASLVAALTLVPMFASKIRVYKKEKKERLFKKSFLSILLGLYRKAIGFVIRCRYFVLLFAFGLFAFFLFLGATKLQKEFIVSAEEGRFTIFVELEPGAKLDVTDKMVADLEKILSNIPEIKSFTSRIEPFSSKVYVKLLPMVERKRSTGEIIDFIRNEGNKISRNYRGGFIYFSEIEESGLKEVIVDLYGYNYDTLKEQAVSMAEKLQKIKEFRDIRMSRIQGRPEVAIVVDKSKAALYGLRVEDIAESLHAKMRGLRATLYRSEGREVETIVRLQSKDRKTFDDLRRIVLITQSGEEVRLEDVATFKKQFGPAEINKKNKERMVNITAMVTGISLEKAVESIKMALSDLKFPNGYFYRIGGDYYRNIESQKQLMFVLILTIVLVLMVLSSLFESYYQPFIIMIAVPLAAIGVVAALMLTHKPISRGVLIGCIMLAGIVVNNSIVLVDRINFLKGAMSKSGLPSKRQSRLVKINLLKSVITAGQDRLRPILMTSLTTVLGMMPMALDKSESANLWSPLAITVIGGLISSTVLTLFVVPSIYFVFDELKSIAVPRKILLLFRKKPATI